MNNNKKTDLKSVKFLKRAKALIFLDYNQELYNEIKKDEKARYSFRESFDNEDGSESDDKITYLHNPLPVPKKRAHKKLDFDYNKSNNNWDIDN